MKCTREERKGMEMYTIAQAISFVRSFVRLLKYSTIMACWSLNPLTKKAMEELVSGGQTLLACTKST